MAHPDLVVERAGAVLTCTLNRPARLNALSQEMCEALTAAIDAASGDEGVRAILLRGAGRAFSAGGDVKAMAEDIAAGRRTAFFEEPLRAIHAAALAVRGVEKPVVAVLHGPVAGAGLNLALCCDYRIGSDDSVLVQAFTNIGLVPDTGGTHLLARLVGLARATELLFEGRPLGAADALRLGLLNEVVPAAQVQAAGLALAERLAARPTRALGAAKRLLNAALGEDFAAQLEREQRTQLELARTSEDFVEGVAAFCEKRPARFSGK